MDRMEAEDFSLFGLLGRSWTCEAPVVDLTFDNGDGAVAFTLKDGSVAIAKIKDQEPAASRIRISAEDGRSSILPRTKPLPPITRLSVQDGAPVTLTAYGKHGFVMGDASGALNSLTIGGERTPFAKPLPAPITAIVHAPETGTIACATADNRVHLLRGPKVDTEILDHDTPIATMAFSPDGQHLSVAGKEAVTQWKIDKTCMRQGELTPSRSPANLAWSPDQTHLALGQHEDGVTIWSMDDNEPIALPDYPAPVRSLAWSENGDNLITSGAFRIIAWPTNILEKNDESPTSLDTGKPSLAAIEAVAPHPSRPLVAAGYENGMLIIAEIGKQDELIIKTEGQGAITVVKWSKDAGHLAIGSDQGLAAIIELPTQLFK